MNDIDLTQVDLNLLVLFDAVFATRHVGAAAERLHVTSSAVSHGLRRLRAHFDDPLFLKVPKGVVPTARASALAPPIGQILAQARAVMGTSTAFDAAESRRRFTIGAPDATAAVLMPRLLAALRREAPGIDLSVRHLLPMHGLDALDTGDIDLVVLAVDDVPPRFFARVVLEEEFVIAARRDHPFLQTPSLPSYCELGHVLVSIVGERHGYIDEVLAKKGLSRRVALSVPSFLLALAALASTDFVAAIPESLLAMHAARFDLASVKAPLSLRRWQLRAVTPKVAMNDRGIAWLFDAVARAAKEPSTPITPTRGSKKLKRAGSRRRNETRRT